jgi:hypothetical protein
MMQHNKKQSNKKYNKPHGASPSGHKNYDYLSKVDPLRFYTEKEEVTLRFYQTPKALFNNPAYKGLALGPKLMYSILRDRLDISIKNNWKDEKGYIYLIFSVEELSRILEAGIRSIIRYKKSLIDYKLIYERRMGQGKPNRIYVLKPELNEKCQIGISRDANKTPQEVPKEHPNNTNVNHTNLSNVNGNEVFNISNDEKEKISNRRERIASYMADCLDDEKSLGYYRKVADNVPESTINHFLSIVKENSDNGSVRNKGAYFNTILKSYLESSAGKKQINS